jgi:hypothetical protein
MGLALTDEATKEKFSFLHINMKEPVETRYRRNLGEIINVGDTTIELPQSKKKAKAEQADDSENKIPNL